MRILLFTDVHWSATGSIVTKYGTKYTTRLEMLINSMTWVNDLAIKENCAAMVCAGDMMDKSTCSDIELTALMDIKWNTLPCYFLCGNHESSAADLRFSTVKCLESENRTVISEPTIWKYDGENEICFLPYVVESDRKPLSKYFEKPLGKRIIISHNDIAGVNYGPVVSRTGFSIEEIESNSDLYLNGHIHNSEFITNKILNLGSLSAHNFSNDSFSYKYGCWILDTDTLELKFTENPYAFNFYKVEINTESDIAQLEGLKANAVVSIKCDSLLVEKTKQKLTSADNIIESRIILTKKYEESSEIGAEIDLSVDHLARFVECCKANIECSALLDEEINEICK